jgi:hypothetical protein
MDIEIDNERKMVMPSVLTVEDFYIRAVFGVGDIQMLTRVVELLRRMARQNADSIRTGDVQAQRQAIHKMVLESLGYDAAKSPVLNATHCCGDCEAEEEAATLARPDRFEQE